MSVLVTGGTGFLGRRIVERLLSQGREVTVLARHAAPDLEARGVRCLRASIDNADAVRDACVGMESVFHVAAKVGVWGSYRDYFHANVLGTRAVVFGCRTHGVKRLIHTSTPSVIYDGLDLAGADESRPLTNSCPSPYPETKAIAEREVLAANCPSLRTIALRPHLIWGVGDPHLVPRVLARAKAGRLRIVGSGKNRVDMVHVENAVDAHLLAEAVLEGKTVGHSDVPSWGRAYFITNDEPVNLWEWINGLLVALGERPVKKSISLSTATSLGSFCEALWKLLPLRGEPPMTRFVASELAKDHWFDIRAAKVQLGYVPRVSMVEGTTQLVEHLRRERADKPRRHR